MLPIIAILALGCGTATAQPALGVRAGLSVSTLSGGDAEVDGLIAPIAGAYARLPLAPGWTIGPEAAITRRRGVAAGAATASIVLEAPVLVVFELPPLANIRPDVQAGPVLVLPLGSREEAAPADVGLTVGTEVTAPLRGRGERFGIGLRYTMGLIHTQAASGAERRQASLAVTTTFQF